MFNEVVSRSYFKALLSYEVYMSESIRHLECTYTDIEVHAWIGNLVYFHFCPSIRALSGFIVDQMYALVVYASCLSYHSMYLGDYN